MAGLGALVLGLAACQLGPFGQANASPTPTTTPSVIAGIPGSDPDGPAKVAGALFPEGGQACGALSGDYSSCPVTTTLKTRLNGHPIQYVEQLCRCNVPYGARTFASAATADGATVHVTLALQTATQSLDVAVERSTGSWLASDITCAGRGTSTSIFSDAPTNCYAPAGG